MAKRATYHVTPRSDGRWNVKQAGAGRASDTAKTQGKAVERARELASGNPRSQVVIHRPNGRIREEHTYGSDPHPPDG